MVAHAHFGFYLGAVSHGHVVQLVAEADDEHVLRVGPCGANTHPYANLALRLFVLPVAYHHFAADAHAGADVAELTVAVGRLVEVHEVHVHRVPRNLLVVLRVEVEQGFLELLQAVYPHLGGREGVHPGDDADAAVVVVGGLHHGFHFLAGVGRALIDYLDGQAAGVVQSLDHFVAVGVYRHYRVATVEELCSGDEPYFVLGKCLFHTCNIVFRINNK